MSTAEFAPRHVRAVSLAISCVGFGLALLAWAVGGWVPAVLLGCATLGAAQGFWRGLAAVVGMLAGLIVAAAVAGPLGRAVEHQVGGALGVAGIAGRLASIGLAGLVVMVLVGSVVTLGAKAALAKRRTLSHVNHWSGGALGLFEGALLGVLLLWIPVALEPVAAARVAAATSADGEASRGARTDVARTVLGLSQDVRQSWIGAAALPLSPAPDSRIFRISEQFIRVINDPDATASLVASPVVEEIRTLPSFLEARRRVMEDASLRRIIESGEVSGADMRTILNSPVILGVLDDTTVAADMAPRAAALVAALEEADHVIATKRRGGG